MAEHGYTCDPDKHTTCPKKHCWRNGGECRITLHYEYATDEEQKKEAERERKNMAVPCPDD